MGYGFYDAAKITGVIETDRKLMMRCEKQEKTLWILLSAIPCFTSVKP